MNIQKRTGFLWTAASYASVGMLILMAIAILPGNAPAQTWDVSSGDWNVADNWSPSGIPGSHDVVSIDNNGTAYVPIGVAGESESLLVGNYGTGSLNISGSVDAYSWIVIGNHAGSSGTVTINAGGGWGSPRVDIGIEGQGTLNINGGNGGSGDATIGNGTVTVTCGGTWSPSSLFIGPGTLNIHGGTVTNIQATVDNAGTVAVTSGSWVMNDSSFSRIENGTVNLAGDGLIFAGNGFDPAELVTGTLHLGTSGTLNLGTGGTAGTLKAAGVYSASGSSTVNFNHTGCYAFEPQLSGSLAVNKLGPGTTVLSASNTYTGATAIEEGRLKLDIDGSISDSSAVKISSCGVFDTTALASGTFTMTGSQLFEFALDPFGSGSAGLLVASGLDITNALVDFIALARLDDPVYVIAQYTSLTGAGFGSVTGLPTGYSLDYAYHGNQIALVQTVPEPGSLALLGAGVACLALLRRKSTIRSGKARDNA